MGVLRTSLPSPKRQPADKRKLERHGRSDAFRATPTEIAQLLGPSSDGVGRYPRSDATTTRSSGVSGGSPIKVDRRRPSRRAGYAQKGRTSMTSRRKPAERGRRPHQCPGEAALGKVGAGGREPSPWAASAPLTGVIGAGDLSGPGPLRRQNRTAAVYDMTGGMNQRMSWPPDRPFHLNGSCRASSGHLSGFARRSGDGAKLLAASIKLRV